jgi:hypothetical protein
VRAKPWRVRIPKRWMRTLLLRKPTQARLGCRRPLKQRPSLVSTGMDPLTALSVATSVISFVDFGSRLLSKSRKLYKSSNRVLTENVDLHIIALDIAILAQGLRRKLPEHRPLSDPSKGSAAFKDDSALDYIYCRYVELRAN